MTWYRKLVYRARALLDRERLDAELDDELRFHLERQIEQYVAEGMSPGAARTRALRLFGGVEKVKEECRDERRVSLADNFVQDVGYAMRTLGKTRSFTALAVLTLALGIGANTAIFSVVNGVLLAPLPYPDGNELVLLQAEAPRAVSGSVRFSIHEFHEYRDTLRSIDLVEYHGMNFTLLGRGYPSSVATGVVSWNFFDVLGLEPRMGRTFRAADEKPGAEPVLVLSYRYWRDHFGADPSIVGQTFEMNDRQHRVIGVLPPIPHYPRYNDVYMPSTACPFHAAGAARDQRGAFRSLTVFGRLVDGAEMVTADGEITGLVDRSYRRYPDVYGDSGYDVKAQSLQTVLTQRARPMLLALAATVSLVLLVACANVANLMLARVMRRDRELALRAAMGAGRGRLLRQLLTESTLLSLAGGVLGLLFAAAGLDLLVDFTARFTPRTTQIHIDGWVLAFTFVVSVVTGIAFGALPGIRSRVDVLQSLRESRSAQATAGRRTLRARSLLIAGQVALSFMLLIGAGLMVRSFVKLNRVDPGFGSENVLTAQVFPNWTAYETEEQVGELYTALLQAIGDGPGVFSAAVSNTVPFADGALVPQRFHVERRPGRPALSGDPRPSVPKPDAAGTSADAYRSAGGEHDEEGWPVRFVPIGVSADYFDTVGIPVVEGRTATRREIDESVPVAMISSSARERYWPDRSPLGERVAIDGAGDDGWVWHEIIGVVADAKHSGLAAAAPEALFASYKSFGGAGRLLVRTSADAETMSAFIQETVHRLAPEQSVQDFRTFQTLRSAAIATPRLATTLISLFAALALLITVAGISGVVAFSVSQRSHEIGIRMALGAQRRTVVGMVLRQGLLMVGVGLAVGVVGALWFSSLVAGFLFETEPTDVATFIGVAFALLAATALACLLPARRATAIDPVTALRVE